MHQGFTVDALLTKDAQEIAMLFAPPLKETSASTRPVPTPNERARYRLWQIIRAMKCVHHEKIPGRHMHVLMRTNPPSSTACVGCHFASERTFGCVLRDTVIMRSYIKRKYPIQTGHGEAEAPPAPLVYKKQPIVWELPLGVSRPR